jgi:aminoglycoside phosphotransferase (APT) family kinase protein
VAVGHMVRRVHELSLEDLPAAYPVPSPSTFPWWDFDAMVAEVRDAVDAPALDAIEREIEAHRDWTSLVATDAVVCHGDVHPGNLLMTGSGPVLLDWDLLCHAHPGWDHAMLLTLADRWGGDPSVYPAFAEGYGRSLAQDHAAATFGRLRNVAATLMRVRAAIGDAGARGEAERRLRYWRGDPDAPAWVAQ